MTPIPEILKTIQERADRATAGPWLGSEGSDSGNPSAVSVRQDDTGRVLGGFWIAEMIDDLPDGSREGNAAFIAACRTDVPRLVRALEAVTDWGPVEPALMSEITRILNEPAE